MIEITITSLITLCFGLLAYLAKKLDKSLDNFNHTQVALQKEISLSHKRLDIIDVIISSILRDPVNSAAISENRSDWPKNVFEKDDAPPKGYNNGKWKDKK